MNRFQGLCPEDGVEVFDVAECEGGHENLALTLEVHVSPFVTQGPTSTRAILSFTYLMAWPFGNQHPITQNLPKRKGRLLGLHEIIAIRHQNFTQCLCRRQKYTFLVEERAEADQAFIGD